MRIGELARRSGLSRDTLRFYERQGLIGSLPEGVASNNYRNYPESLLERLEAIAQAQAAGFSVADLRFLFGAVDAGDFPAEVAGFLNRKILEAEVNIARATRFLELLRNVKAALDAPK